MPMIIDDEKADDVKIYAPDKSLQIKIGVPNLDQVFTTQKIEAAQTAIVNASDAFMDESLELMNDLRLSFAELATDPITANPALTRIIDDAFLIKTKTGIGGYTLISSLAKSLQLNAESAKKDGMTDKMLQILKWHVGGLDQFLKQKVKGIGGSVGEEILNEILRLDANQEK